MQIQIYSTLGNLELNFEEEKSSWKNIKNKLQQLGLFIEGMQLLIGEKNLRDKYIEEIPKEDFTLFILPKNTKSSLGENAWKPFIGSVNFNKNGNDYQKELRNEW